MHKKISTSLVASFLLATNLFSAQELESITVTSATKTSQSIKDVTSNIDVITSEEIEAKHFTTVVEALNTIPGINFVSNGGMGKATSVYLRGMGSNQTLVLIDGIRYNDPTSSSGGAAFEHLMIGDIERIEVLKGPQSSVWGADASAGVINIITKSAKEGTYGSIAVEYGSFDTKKVNATISHKEKNFDAKLNVSRLDSDGFSSKAPKGKRVGDYEDDGYENTSADLKLGYNFDENNRLELNHKIINAKAEYDLGDPNSKDDLLRTKNNYSSVNYTNINDFAELKFYANNSKIKVEDPTGWTKDFNGSVQEYGANATVPYLHDSSFLLIGTDYKEFEHKDDFNKKYNNKAIYITNNNKFNNDNTILTQSLRLDSYDKFDNKTTGKIGIKQYIIDDLNVSSNYGTGYNVPTIYQLYTPFYGNENLKPEKTKGYDFQIEYKGLSTTYFNNQVENLYGFDPFTYQSLNVDGKSKLKGYEIAYKKDVIEDLFLSIGYTHLSAKDSKQNRLLNRSDDKVNFAVDYYGISKLHLNLNGEYVGDRKAFGNIETGNYTLWNSVVNYEINKTFSTYLKVDNIFNKYYQVIDGYATAERSAYIGLKASF